MGYQQTELLDKPLLDLGELELARPIAIPEIFLRHRNHHKPPNIDAVNFNAEKDVWNKIPENQRGAIIHVLTRFAFGMSKAMEVLAELEKAADKGGCSHPEQYAALKEDTQYIIDICKKYRLEVAGKEDDLGAYTPGYLQIFDEILPDRVKDLANSLANGTRREQIQAEAKLRTVYHVIGEGLGAITGVWGMNAAMRELQSKEIELPSLAKLIGDITLIERRHIAFGLHEMGELAKEKYFATVLSIVREFKAVRPILDQMRTETFNRWGAEFPFAINKDEIAAMGKKRILGWVGSNIIVRPNGAPRKRLKSLAGVV